MHPGTFRISCTLCSYAQQSGGVITFAVRDDGTEAICGSPPVARMAEEATGRPWNELVEAGRIRHRYSLICLSCGANDFYPGARTPREAAALSCRSCGKTGLYPISGDDGCLAAIVPWLRRPRCPVCKEGVLVSECVAIV